MKNRLQRTTIKIQPRIVATFGRASLVRIAGSNYELRGATQGELTAAKEWVSMFLHEAVLGAAPSLYPANGG